MNGRRKAQVSARWIGWTLVFAAVAAHGGNGLSAAEPIDEAAAIQKAKSLSIAFRAASRKVVPTVVEIRTMINPHGENGESSPEPGSPFQGTPWEDFFDDQMPGFRFHSPDQPLPGLGSGVIIDPSGIVLTNNHVVADADKVVVQLSDGRRYDAVEIKTDEKTDLAVVRIKPEESLPAAQLGDSDQLEIGDWVIAVGNPFELQQTVSAGIISAKGRSIGTADSRANFLQTDAAINPGNSGGPLVNLDGEVVGINTAIFSRSGGYQGIGFAIPINVAKWVTPQLIKRGSVQRSYLGVQIEEITAEKAGGLGVKPSEGVVLGRISAGSPAQKAGLRTDDVILRYDGQPIHTANDLQQVVERSSAGSRHRLDILRDGKPATIEVVVAAMPDSFGVASFLEKDENGEELPSGAYRSSVLGLAVVDLSPAMAEQLGTPEATGVLAVQVNRQGPSYAAGLREGMVIVAVAGKPVKSIRDFRLALSDQSIHQGISMEVRTNRGVQKITIRAS